MVISPPQGNNFLLLRNARVVLPQRVVEDATVLVENGRVASINVSRRETVSGWQGSELDLGSLTLFPGFIDIHIHGAMRVDTMDATAADLSRVSGFLVENGE